MEIDKPKKVTPFWLDKDDWKDYIQFRNKDLGNAKIDKSIADKFRDAYNLSSIIFIGGFSSALVVPTFLSLILDLDSEFGGNIFMAWMGIVFLLTALILFYEAYFSFKFNLTGTLNIVKFIHNGKEKSIFAKFDPVESKKWGLAYLIIGAILIGIDVFIFLVFYLGFD